MLTPRFKLTQDDNHVYINVHAPYTNIGDTEIDVDGENFLFVSSPYFLRLRLPGRIQDNERSKGSYICDSGEFNLVFDKESPGEHFENLDMITSLLAPRDIPDINPNLVEMLEEDGITLENDAAPANENKFTYGFASKLSAEFHSIGCEFSQIFELRTPESVAIQERNIKRKKHEDNKFSSDHYIADFFDDELLDPYQSAKPSWESPDFNKDVQFTDDEVSILKELPNKHYLLTKSEYKQVVMGLVDILFGYCYDKRTTLNESTVESSWTINKLSSTLSWFCVFNNLEEVLVACYRRALIYPIFRNFELCNKVKGDLISLLKIGKKFTVKCMIEIHQMFNASNDARYILNQLYIKDYLVFLQKCRNEEIDELCNNIVNIVIKKENLGLDLIDLEKTAQMLQHDEARIMENEIAIKLASMSLISDLNRGNMSDIDENDESDDGSSEGEPVESSDESSDDSTSESGDELDSDDDGPS